MDAAGDGAGSEGRFESPELTPGEHAHRKAEAGKAVGFGARGGKAPLVLVERDPTARSDEVGCARALDQLVMLGNAGLDQRQQGARRLLQIGGGRVPPVACKPRCDARQIGGVVADIGRSVDRVFQQCAELTRKGVGNDRGAFDQPGIAVACAAARLAPIRDHDRAAAILQMKGGTDPDDTGAENENVCFHG
jgi:hypothetical protein